MISHKLRLRRRAFQKYVQYALMRNVLPRSSEELACSKNGPKVLLNSMPKAGTNLLSQLMRMLPGTVPRWSYHIDETLPGIERQLRAGRQGQVISAHLPWNHHLSELVSDLDYRILFMVRDPRDVAISNVNYVTRMDLAHPLHEILKRLPDDDARLSVLIDPPEEVLAVLPEIWRNQGLSTFLPWLDEPNCLLVRFEDLIGAKGGGSDARQLSTILAIAAHVGVQLDDRSLQDAASDLFGNAGSKTFFQGQINRWVSEFKPHHSEAFKRRSGLTLSRLGYEKSDAW